MIKHVVSFSGGKDSTATLLIALENCPRESVIPIFCDTGNEHDDVHAYLDYIESTLNVKIIRLKADFSEQIESKRMFIARDMRTRRKYATAPVFDAEGNPVPKRDSRGNVVMHKGEPVQKTKKIGGGQRVRWTNKGKRRALAALYPTGNPFLDLCMWKGRFPSRKAQFCTEELKRNMAVEFQLELIDQGHQVLSWQGVRRDESHARKDAKKIQRMNPKMWAFRPLVDMTAMDVFELAEKRGVLPNPLYKQGMGRVGCMPCINCKKEELRQIAGRFPYVIEQKKDWEAKVSACSKRGYATFFASTNSPVQMKGAAGRRIDMDIFAEANIEQIVIWSKTTRGGKQLNLLDGLIEPTACSSAFGLCE